MNIPKKIIRENHNGILIEVEALIDFDIGIMRCLKDDYKNSDSSIIDINYITQSDNTLFENKIKDKNFIENAFLGNAKQHTKAVFNSYLEEKTEYVIKFSPLVPSINRLIDITKRNRTNVAHCAVITKNEKYIPYLKKRFPEITILNASENNKNDFKQYARFIVEDINKLYDYGKIEFTYITVMNYAKNFEDLNGKEKGTKRVLSPKPVIIYGHTNEFDIIDPLIRRN